MDPDKNFTVTHDGRVFDIKDFLKLHPGGENYLRPYKNKEIAERMKHMKHTPAAYHLLNQYKEEGDENNESQENLDTLVDLDKPMLYQVIHLGERYNEWVLLPVNRRLRYYQNEFLECLTFTPWYAVILFWVPIISYLFVTGLKHYLTVTQDPSPFFPVVFHLISGALIYTLLEYALHRWILHIKPSGKSKAMIYFHFVLHGMHHKAPYDGYRLVFPPVPAFVIALILYTILSPFFPESTRFLTASGTAACFLVEDMIHFYLHFGSPTPDGYFYYLKRCHMQHHFVNPDSAYAVSSDFWDTIFGSRPTLQKLAKPIKW